MTNFSVWIIATLLWVACLATAIYLDRFVVKVSLLALSIESICLQMVVCTNDKEAAIVVTVLLQLVVIFAFFAKLYGSIALSGLVSPLHEVKKGTPIIHRITGMNPAAARKTRLMFMTLTTVFAIATITLRNILLYPDIINYDSLRFYASAVMLAMTFHCLMYLEKIKKALPGRMILILFVSIGEVAVMSSPTYVTLLLTS